jgi:hypothetical protein
LNIVVSPGWGLLGNPAVTCNESSKQGNITILEHNMEPSSLEGVKEAHDKAHHDEGYVWQDKEIRFDTSPSDLELRKGEVILDALVCPPL